MSPTNEQIAQWKEEYVKVYKVKLAGYEYYYRALERGEYKNIQDKATTPESQQNMMMGMPDPRQAAETEEEMVRTCVLYPEVKDLDKLPAGVPSSLSNYIAEASGFSLEAEPEEL